MKTTKNNKMISYILSLDKYPTMSSWNNSYGYSFNVKIHSLPIKKEQKDKLYDLLDSDGFFDSFNFLIEDFDGEMAKVGTHRIKKEMQINVEGKNKKEIKELKELYERGGWTYDRCGTAVMTLWKNQEESNFSAGFNGRSGGHLVLYRWNGHNYGGTGWTHTQEELEAMESGEVKEIYDILQEFEKLYQNIIKQAEYLADNFVSEEESYHITKTRRVLAGK